MGCVESFVKHPTLTEWLKKLEVYFGVVPGTNDSNNCMHCATREMGFSDFLGVFRKNDCDVESRKKNFQFTLFKDPKTSVANNHLKSGLKQPQVKSRHNGKTKVFAQFLTIKDEHLPSLSDGMLHLL